MSLSPRGKTAGNRLWRLRVLGSLALLFVLAVLTGCKNPPVPPEVEKAVKQERELWGAGANIYAPEEYGKYLKSLRDAKDNYLKENARFVLFRDYEKVKEEYEKVITSGESIGKLVETRKLGRQKEAEDMLSLMDSRIKTIKWLSSIVNEGRYSRKDLTMADLLAEEARSYIQKGKYDLATGRLKKSSAYSVFALEPLLPILNRFSDKSNIAKWRAWAGDTVRESASTGGYAVVVSKIDRKLTLYKGGKPVKEYDIGIGFNGSKDKLYAGDKATPEGRYKIVKKKNKSSFYKALLINYPNESDMAQFKAAKKKGLVPRQSGVGGLIEIHGGGKEGMTYGCVALDNHHMEELFNIVDAGTPVTIVGATENHSGILSAMEELGGE